MEISKSYNKKLCWYLRVTRPPNGIMVLYKFYIIIIIIITLLKHTKNAHKKHKKIAINTTSPNSCHFKPVCHISKKYVKFSINAGNTPSQIHNRAVIVKNLLQNVRPSSKKAMATLSGWTESTALR